MKIIKKIKFLVLLTIVLILGCNNDKPSSESKNIKEEIEEESAIIEQQIKNIYNEEEKIRDSIEKLKATISEDSNLNSEFESLLENLNLGASKNINMNTIENFEENIEAIEEIIKTLKKIKVLIEDKKQFLLKKLSEEEINKILNLYDLNINNSEKSRDLLKKLKKFKDSLS